MSTPELKQDVISGLFKPSGLSAIVACVTALCCTLFYLLYITPERILHLTPELATHDGDDDIFLTSTVLGLKKNTPAGQAVFLLGDSSIRDAVRKELLQKTLFDAGLDYSVVDLRSGGQTILESLAIVDNIPETSAGIVVLGNSPRRLYLTSRMIDWAQKGSRRGFSSLAVDQYLSEYKHKSSRKTGIYGLDNFWFVVPRLVQNIYDRDKQDFSHVEHRNEGFGVLPEHVLEEMEASYMSVIKKPYKAYSEDLGAGREVLRRIDRLVGKNQNLSLLMLETPLNPEFIDIRLGRNFYSEHIIDAASFYKENNMLYFNANDLVKFSSTDFIDVVHLSNTAAINRYTKIVANKLLAIING